MPLYFGPTDGRLFGLYDPAQGKPKSRGIVICQPLWTDYTRSVATLTSLSKALSADGFHVLRFDYRGTGESELDESQATLARWGQDIRTATEELKEMTGVEGICLVGVRLGGTLALLEAPTDPLVDRIVLWDPVLSGSDYLGELNELQKRFVQKLNRRVRHACLNPTELLGHRVSFELMNSIFALGNIANLKVSVPTLVCHSGDFRPTKLHQSFSSIPISNTAGWGTLGKRSSEAQPGILHELLSVVEDYAG